MLTYPKLLTLDIDGVLTDGHIQLSVDGHEVKRINFHDLDALTRLKQQGLQVAFVTGESGPMVEIVGQRFGIESITRGAKDKLAALTTLAESFSLELTDIWYVGDSDRDAPALEAAGFGIAPANATPRARQAANHVLKAHGGDGVVGEIEVLLNGLLFNASDLMPHLERIVQESIHAHQRLLDESLPVLAEIAGLVARTLQSSGKIIVCGSDAQHVAGELVRRSYAAIALTADTSILTYVGNDWYLENIFAHQVRSLAKPGDLLVGISTSGNSPNILKAMETARQMGVTTIGFTGDGDSHLPNYCDICFHAPSTSPPHIQVLHMLAWHSIRELAKVHLDTR